MPSLPLRTSPFSRRLAAIAVLALFAVGAPAAAQPNRYLIDTGPLRIRDQFLPGLGYLGFDPVSADILAEGEWQVDLVLTLSNTFAHSMEVEEALANRNGRSSLTLDELRALGSTDSRGLFHLDGEHARWAFAARRGIGHGLQVELVVPVTQVGGGFLDSTIEGFHDTFSLGQAGRLGVPRDRFTAYLRHDGREVVLDRSPGTALGDIVIGLRRDLLAKNVGMTFELAVEGLAKLPTGDVDRLSGSGSADFGVQLLGTRYFQASCLHFSLGVARLGPHELFDLEAQSVLSGMMAWELSVGARTSALVQATVSQSPFAELDDDELGSASTQLTLGMKRVVGANVIFLGITENLANFNNTADIGLHLGVTRAFGRGEPSAVTRLSAAGSPPATPPGRRR